MSNKRWILHVDMDAFYASIEQLDNPDLRGKPVIIGGSSERGVVSTASYEARKCGVRSAMPLFQARKLCPNGIYVDVRMSRYKEKSLEVFACLQEFSPLIEPASIDEAYLDLTGLERIFGPVQALADRIRFTVLEQTGLSCSVGLAPVKFLAKITSEIKKPNGTSIITHDMVPDFLDTLPVRRLPGVGKSTMAILESLGVTLTGQVLRYPLDFWERKLGKAGTILFKRAHGIDERPVEPYTAPKSESAENTLMKDTLDKEELSVWLLRQSERVGTNLRKQGLAGRTITLKVKYADFVQITRSRTLQEPTNLTRRIYETGLELFTELKPSKPIRLIGVGVSQFGVESQQLNLFSAEAEKDTEKEIALEGTIDQLRDKFGRNAVIRGKLFR